MSSMDLEGDKSENELNGSNIISAGENTHDSQEEIDTVPDLVQDSVPDSVQDSVPDSVQDSVPDSVQDSVPDSVPHVEEEQKEKLVQLPLGRVKSIVKMDPDVNLVTQEAIFIITKSTELFIESLTKEAYKYTSQAKKKTVQKQDVQSAIENADALVFLEGMM